MYIIPRPTQPIYIVQRGFEYLFSTASIPDRVTPHWSLDEQEALKFGTKKEAKQVARQIDGAKVKRLRKHFRDDSKEMIEKGIQERESIK